MYKVGDNVQWVGLSGRKLTGRVVNARYGTYVIERNGALVTRTSAELVA